jgi:hypothetical protein
MIEDVTMKRTSDGSIFHDEDEAAVYERHYQNKQLVEKYLALQDDMKPATKTRAKQAILDFLDWRQD